MEQPRRETVHVLEMNDARAAWNFCCEATANIAAGRELDFFWWIGHRRRDIPPPHFCDLNYRLAAFGTID
jgi:hypothetical protein